MIKTAAPDRNAATLAHNLAASGMNCRTPRQSAPDAPQTPLYYVRRWTGKGWRTASKPLPQRDALDVAARLKAGGASGFHVRLEQVKGKSHDR